eukprot:TRINITY_DN5008_c0_g1_i3.p1 TRINITY_DN5008_c0_g1~~TRINITY_DN5008_c0_g1_i3.p1  ORF type:complete len:430 (-),score=106.78 TRINITY_DN5008_c0_g1_i3:368-1657(-)
MEPFHNPYASLMRSKRPSLSAIDQFIPANKKHRLAEINLATLSTEDDEYNSLSPRREGSDSHSSPDTSTNTEHAPKDIKRKKSVSFSPDVSHMRLFTREKGIHPQLVPIREDSALSGLLPPPPRDSNSPPTPKMRTDRAFSLPTIMPDKTNKKDIAAEAAYLLRLKLENMARSQVDRSKSVVKRDHRLKSGQVLQVRFGDITDEYVDVIVNGANSSLAHGGGFAGALVRKGGRDIQTESDRWIRRHGTVPTGCVAFTGPGALPCKIVVHAVGPIWRGGNRGEDKELFDAVYNSMMKAQQFGFKSIAFPAISCGIFGFPAERCAYLLVDAVVKFCREFPDSTVRSIRFTHSNRDVARIFEEEMEGRFSEGGDGLDSEEEEEEDPNEDEEILDENESESLEVGSDFATPPPTPQFKNFSSSEFPAPNPLPA